MKAGSPPPPAWNRLLLLSLLVGTLAYARFRAVTGWGGVGLPCPFRTLTGLPCPFCFGTKAWILMMQGRVVEAITYNPLAVLLFVFAIGAACWLIAAIAFGLPRHPINRWSDGNRFWFVALMIMLANWAYSLTRFLISG
jgi:hypothetical protein